MHRSALLRRFWSVVLLPTLLGCSDVGGNDPGPAASDSSDGAQDDTSAQQDTNNADSNPGADVPTVTDGAARFKQVCASCHGEDGKGLPGLAPSVRFVPKGFGAYTVRTGRDAMPFPVTMAAYSEASLDEPALQSILDHLHTLDRPTDGKGLFDMLCANCHGEDGLGGRVGKAVKGEAHEVVEMIRNGHHPSDYADDEFMPAWTEAELSSAEVALVKAHVATF